MSEESSDRIDRIKKILEIETDTELAALCQSYHTRISQWRNNGFPESTGNLLDVLMDKYDADKKPKRGRPPNLSIGQRIRKARRERRLSQKELGLMVFRDEDLNENTLQIRIRRLEKKEVLDAETLEKVADALGVPLDAL